MKQIPVRSKGEVVAEAIVDDDMYDELNRYRWALHKAGYAYRSRHSESVLEARSAGRKSRRSEAVLMHRVVLRLQLKDGLRIDHVDRNPLNNQRSNLRLATQAQNLQNVPSRGGSSKYRGVSWHSALHKWQAFASLEGKRFNLGYFEEEEEAAHTACEWRKTHMQYAID